jgi:hypothetical protein
MSHSPHCGHATHTAPDEETKLHELQRRIDEILAGTPKRTGITRPVQHQGLFAEFLPGDKQRAIGLAALCTKKAEKVGGLEGLEAAIDCLYENLARQPLGMVEYAAKLFLTHYQPARQHLQIRSLEERQPGMVKPSEQLDIRVADRVELARSKAS